MAIVFASSLGWSISFGAETQRVAGYEVRAYTNPGYETLDKIMKLQPSADISDKVALIVYQLADEVGNQDGKVTRQEVINALDEMWDASGLIADHYVGNGNRIVELDEIKRLSSSVQEYAGLAELKIFIVRFKNQLVKSLYAI